MTTLATSSIPSRTLRRVLRAILIAWAAFWAWFVLVSSYGGAETPPPWWIPVLWLTSLTGLVALGWRWPRAGGLALVAAGVASALYFPHPAARTLLSLPAIALGAGFVLVAARSRAALSAPSALLAVILLFPACLVPQDPADHPFQTRSILRHENGGMRRAFLLEETEIAGLPCQRWVWWYEDGSLDNAELAHDRAVQGHEFPAGTRLFFDREERLAHAWLERDATIDGLPCRGGMKIDTAFHPSGRVRAFFPPDAIEIDGILCSASVFHPVYLHPSGRLQQCRLAADATLAGETFARGTTIALDESGRPRR